MNADHTTAPIEIIDNKHFSSILSASMAPEQKNENTTLVPQPNTNALDRQRRQTNGVPQSDGPAQAPFCRCLVRSNKLDAIFEDDEVFEDEI